jgi:RNA polymerase sigma-70 factor (ECF subfamily)
MARLSRFANKTMPSQPHTDINRSGGLRDGESNLIERARAREETAIRAIIRANNQRLYRLARGILRDDAEAEDVVQDTYMRLFTHLDEFRGESSLTTWLSRIAINEALGRVRKRKLVAPLPSADATTSADIIPFPRQLTSEDPETTMAQREIQTVVERAIDELPDVFRIVFVARVMEGMSIEATADLLDLNTVTVKTRLHRARKMLRDCVERQIGPVAMNAFPFAGRRCDRLTDIVMKRLGF